MKAPTESGGGSYWEARLYAIATSREFRELLNSFQRYREMTGADVAEAAKAAGGPSLSEATVTSTLAGDELPSLQFVRQFLTACGMSEESQDLWIQVRQALEDGQAPLGGPQRPAAAPTDGPGDRAQGAPSGPSWVPPIVRQRWQITLTAVVLMVSLITGGLLWHDHDEKDRVNRERTARELQETQDFQAHCNTKNQALLKTSDGCSGITDGRDGPGIFGQGLKPALTVIDAENQAVVKAGGYVTVALMGPLTTSDTSLTGNRATHQVEGAAIAQHELNQGGTYPKIRLVLANMGSDETSWPTVVDHLKTMTGGSDHLVAVTGMGLSQKESIDAARSLSKASIPMVGDLITADGFDTTGAIDGGGAIDGLVRIAPNTSTQLQAIAQEIRKHADLKTAALVSAPNTPNGTDDFYTKSQEAAVHNPAIGLLPYLQAGSITFRFDARNDAVRTGLDTISNNLCGKVEPDLVFYAGRANHLDYFLEDLRQRPCHTTPITVVTGSDAATLDRSLRALNDPQAPISVLYVPLADPDQLGDGSNPDRGLFQDFADEFARDHHGQQFDKKDLASGWAVMAHDAVFTAGLAIRKSVDTPQNPPSVHAVKAQLYLFDSTNVIRGAGGIFRIDPQTGNRKSTREPQVVRLGAPARN
ncbi:helix-turn-helix domain-containing protein [Streptomyces sp. NPDC096033]|uniref:ABC transporter substrate-binding protein n=1 Tax=Streptomyces sp. NPDC096033 TaxID=3366071 RepID=UPI003829A41A